MDIFKTISTWYFQFEFDIYQTIKQSLPGMSFYWLESTSGFLILEKGK